MSIANSFSEISDVTEARQRDVQKQAEALPLDEGMSEAQRLGPVDSLVKDLPLALDMVEMLAETEDYSAPLTVSETILSTEQQRPLDPI
ncbi:hypothetical protein [Deinococcus ruber]|uniref:hypothetical protein n=1 Tax=Deinococcus ruber TaxID=1848197 RepID=UPI001664048F|nr:hypothetical protein [Deinococcus ruber]